MRNFNTNGRFLKSKLSALQEEERRGIPSYCLWLPPVSSKAMIHPTGEILPILVKQASLMKKHPVLEHTFLKWNMLNLGTLWSKANHARWDYFLNSCPTELLKHVNPMWSIWVIQYKFRKHWTCCLCPAWCWWVYTVNARASLWLCVHSECTALPEGIFSTCKIMLMYTKGYHRAGNPK